MEDWQARWEKGRIGWHEADGNRSLRQHWMTLTAGSRVLVPLCGKTPDLLWLAEQGLEVTGVELSEIAVRAFIDENSLACEDFRVAGQRHFRARQPTITLVVGDYFDFAGGPFDALYDRGSLVALPMAARPAYVQHTKSLLKPAARQLLITLTYDDCAVSGPPFSVSDAEVQGYWPDLEPVSRHNDIDNGPPKFRDAGLKTVTETVWVNPR